MFNLFRKSRPAEPIYLFNTATRTKDRFVSRKEGEVLMYSCGPTVYEHAHIGNLRSYLVPDLVRRLLAYSGYAVKHTINVTDFGHLTSDADAGEDKIVSGMRREGYEITLPNMRAFAEPYIESFKSDLAAFGNLPPTTLARASDYVREQIALIESLIQKGHAYETSDGIYFDVATYPPYGMLGNVDLAKLRAGARVEANPEKRNPADFALWKKSDLGWESGWGTGFPGWHIECTAMAFATLDKQIDIHTGGEDLKYTHHNGEIAQAEAVTGKRYVRYWLHNAFVTANEEKLSKSKGTGIRLADLAAKGFSPLEYRYWLLGIHYRTPANFTLQALDGARQALLRLRRLVYEEYANVRASEPRHDYESAFIAALADDLDTPRALSILFDLVKDPGVAAPEKLATIYAFDSMLSLGLSKTPEEGRRELGLVDGNEIPKEVQELVSARETARLEKDWAEADRIRDEIKARGFLIEDAPRGPRLSRN